MSAKMSLLTRSSFDLDSHEMIPMHMWPEAFGEESDRVIELVGDLMGRIGENSLDRPDISGDAMAITEETVWNQKGIEAPGAIDLGRRPDVLDAMGCARQLIFPTMAIQAINLAINPSAHLFYGFDAHIDAKEVGRIGVRAHNGWVTRSAKLHGVENLRPVAVVLTESLEQMMRDATDVLAGGARAIWIPSSVAPAQTSPADTALDPFWKLIADADVPLVPHLGTEGALMSPQWYANAPVFSYGDKVSAEFPIEPYRASTLNFTHENFLTTMVLGGVFERHPGLRFGVIECGAQWVGPLAERLDLWATQFTRLRSLQMKPSEYLARNVRVTPFVFEPVGQYLDRHPDLASVYSFSSDYPHREGGRWAKQVFYDEISRHGAEAVDMFFRGNAEWLMPA